MSNSIIGTTKRDRTIRYYIQITAKNGDLFYFHVNKIAHVYNGSYLLIRGTRDIEKAFKIKSRSDAETAIRILLKESSDAYYIPIKECKIITCITLTKTIFCEG